jgi:hypothetical protein
MQYVVEYLTHVSVLHLSTISFTVCLNELVLQFSNTLSPYSSLNVRDQVLHPYRTTGKIIVLYILTFMFWTADERTKGSGLNGSKHYGSSISS